jgi:hypothetical protein
MARSRENSANGKKDTAILNECIGIGHSINEYFTALIVWTGTPPRMPPRKSPEPWLHKAIPQHRTGKIYEKR